MYCVLTILRSYLVLYTKIGVRNFQHGKRQVSVSGKNETGVCILLLQRIEIRNLLKPCSFSFWYPNNEERLLKIYLTRFHIIAK